MSKPKVHPDSPNQSYLYGYAAGLRDGAERERRALWRAIKKNIADPLGDDQLVSVEFLRYWLASRKKKKNDKNRS